MFSYHHHIGDFRRDTASLSDVDAMAYLKLLWMYYDTEAPLPADAKLLAFKIGSTADSVQLILDAFFTLDGNVYRQKRCDAEIQAYYERKTVARDKANKRWKNATASINDATALQQNSASIAAGIKNDANREPRTEKKTNTTPQRPDDVSETVWDDWLKQRKSLKAIVTETVIKKIRGEASKAGISFESALEMMCLRSWRGFQAEWLTKQNNSTNVNQLGRRVI